MIDHKTLLEVLDYDPETGIFRWKHYYGRAVPGKIAGCPHEKGRIKITVNGTRYRAARLAWFYMTGEWPGDVVDHVDGDCSNDRWINLRDTTTSVNMRNQNNQINRNNTSGYRGVSFLRGRWIAQFNTKYLGSFETPEKAAEVYKSYVRTLEDASS